ncbi:unnamed protein product [Caenorhabditis sp. 36 PRJEB53466]|nr:unnamed protein product [Caenorhabditis sp. 36 PRJEB53466]
MSQQKLNEMLMRENEILQEQLSDVQEILQDRLRGRERAAEPSPWGGNSRSPIEPSGGAQNISIRDMIESIDKFSGEDPDLYPEFINQFDEQVHHNGFYTAATKYCILKKCLTGEARKLVTTTTFTEEDYRKTRELLEATYAKDRVPKLMRKFKDLPIDPNDYMRMDTDISRHVAIANQLNQNGVPMDHPLMIDELIKKLPVDIMSHVVKRMRSSRMTFLQVISAIRDKIVEKGYVEQAREDHKRKMELAEICAVGDNRKSESGRKGYGNRERPESSADNRKSGWKKGKDESNPKPKGETVCRFCGSDHYTAFCSMSMDEREKVVEEKKLCRHCISKYHPTKKCKYPKKCYLCQEMHSMFLCPLRRKIGATRKEQDPVFFVKAPPPPANKRLRAGTESYNTIHVPQATLPTATIRTDNANTVQTKNGGSGEETREGESEEQRESKLEEIIMCSQEDALYRLPQIKINTPKGERLLALIDSGATRSLVSERAAERLRLPILRSEEMKVIGINGAGTVKSNRVRLQFKGEKGFGLDNRNLNTPGDPDHL